MPRRIRLVLLFALAGLLALGLAHHVLATPGFTFSTNQALPDSTLFLGFTNFDTEPGIKLDSADNVFPAAIHGVPGGRVVWKAPQSTCSSSGCSFQFLGEVDELPDGQGLALGGGDEDHAIGSFGAGNPGPVVVASLWLGSITVVRSTDGGQTWFMNPFASAIPGDDRQWVVADGPTTFFMSFHDVATDNIDVLESQDGGLTWLPVGTAIDAATEPAALDDNVAGEIKVDLANQILYQIFIAGSSAQQNVSGGPLNAVYVGVSSNAGQTWTDHLVYAGSATANFQHLFPAAAVDQAGNVYAVWSDGQNIFLSASTDHGSTWTLPAQVNRNSAALEASIFPWIVAGVSGAVDIAWYGTSSTSASDSSAQWNVFFAQSLNATSASPTFSQTIASDHVIHTGPICQNGLGCTGTGNRDLADLFMVDADSKGLGHIAYADDHLSDSSGNPITQTYFTFQTSGSTIGPPSQPVHGKGNHARGEGTVAGPEGTDDTAQFGLDVDDLGSGPAGTVTLLDPVANLDFVSTSIESIVVNGTEAVITGNSSLGSFTLTVDSGANTFALSLSNGYKTSGPLQSGGLDVWSL